MEQSTSNSDGSNPNSASGSLLHLFSDYEKMVAEILLDLPNLIEVESRPRPRITFDWSCRRKRSAVGLNPSSASPHHCRLCSWSSSSRSLERSRHGENEMEKRTANVNSESSSSATTPLIFLPRESDRKSKHSRKKISKKLRKAKLLENIEELTQTGNILKMEIETLNIKCEKTVRLEFEAVTQELRSCPMKPHLKLSTSINSGIKLNQHIIHPTLCAIHDHTQIQIIAHEKQFTLNQTADVLHTNGDPHGPTSLSLPTGSELDQANLVGSFSIPTVNSAAGDTFGLSYYQPLDQHRVLSIDRVGAAEARRRRIVKRRELRNASATANKSQQC